MTSFQITDEQKSFFDEFGFLVFRQFFSPEEMETIGREAQAAFDEIYPEGRDGGTHGRWVALLDPSTPFSASLLEDERVYTGIRLPQKSRQMPAAESRPSFAATTRGCSTTLKMLPTATPTGSPRRKGTRSGRAGSNVCAISKGSGNGNTRGRTHPPGRR